MFISDPYKNKSIPDMTITPSLQPPPSLSQKKTDQKINHTMLLAERSPYHPRNFERATYCAEQGSVRSSTPFGLG